jgi:hypothetical protein
LKELKLNVFVSAVFASKDFNFMLSSCFSQRRAVAKVLPGVAVILIKNFKALSITF